MPKIKQGLTKAEEKRMQTIERWELKRMEDVNILRAKGNSEPQQRKDRDSLYLIDLIRKLLSQTQANKDKEPKIVNP